MNRLSAAALALCLLPGLVLAQDVAPGLKTQVVFTDYAPEAGDAQVLQRMLTPLAWALAQQKLAASHTVLADQSIDLARERFTVYVPATRPKAGYGLIVFVPPWRDAHMPLGWARTLDRAGVIFVSAANAGNDQDILGRRIPLALLALDNVRRRYPVDPERTYVAGFSGGSRVAMRIALQYPDLFRGALLNAGSDPVAESASHLPPAELLARAQQSSRFVYVSGEDDSLNVSMDAASRQSMAKACIFGIDGWTTPHAGHEGADAATLARALAALDAQGPPDAGKLAACRQALEAAVGHALDQAQALIAKGRRDAARALLLKIDAGYGGMAQPRIVQLAQDCDCRILDR